MSFLQKQHDLLKGMTCPTNAPLRDLDKKQKKDPEIVTPYLRKDGFDLQHCHPKLQNDKKVVLAAVTQNGLALKHASEALRRDMSIVNAAIQQNPYALMHASPLLQDDKGVVKRALKNAGLVLKYASKRIQNSAWAVKIAVEENPAALKFASRRLCGEGWSQNPNVQSIVFEAVTNGREDILPFVQGEVAGRIATDYVRSLAITSHHSHDTLGQQCMVREKQRSLSQESNDLQTLRSRLESQLQDIETKIKKNAEERKQYQELADSLKRSIDHTPCETAAPQSTADLTKSPRGS